MDEKIIRGFSFGKRLYGICYGLELLVAMHKLIRHMVRKKHILIFDDERAVFRSTKIVRHARDMAGKA